MTDRSKLEVQISLRDQLSAGLGKIRDGLDRVEAGANKAFKWIGFGAAAAGVAALAASVVGLVSGFNALKGATMAWAEADLSLRRIGVSAGQIGLNFKELRPELEATIGNLESLTTIGDTELAAAFAQLIRDTKDWDTSLQALDVSAKLSIGTGENLAAMSDAVAKALLGETMALGRMMPGLKAWLAEGRSAAEILARLKTESDGAAEAVRGNLLIALANLANQAENVWKLFGGEAANLIAEGINAVGDALNTLANDGVPVLGALGEEVGLFFADMGAGLAELIEEFGKAENQEMLRKFFIDAGFIGEGSYLEQVNDTWWKWIESMTTGGGLERALAEFGELGTTFRQQIQPMIDSLDDLATVLKALAESIKLLQSVWGFLSTIGPDTMAKFDELQSGFEWAPDAARKARESQAGENPMDPDWWRQATGRAGGGLIRGPAGRDVIPAWVTAGEAVINERQQDDMGAAAGIDFAALAAMAGVPGFADGGKVPDYQYPTWDELMAWEAEHGDPSKMPSTGYRGPVRRDIEESASRAGPSGATAGGEPMLISQNLDSPYLWDQIAARVSARDISYLRDMARFLADRIALIRRFPAIGAGQMGGQFEASSSLERKMRDALAMAGDREWSHTGAEGWARMSTGGRVPGGGSTRLRRPSAAVGGQPQQIVINTFAADQPAVRRVGLAIHRRLLGITGRRTMSRGWLGRAGAIGEA